MRIAIDTNVLAYAEGIGDITRRDTSRLLLERWKKEDRASFESCDRMIDTRGLFSEDIGMLP